MKRRQRPAVVADEHLEFLDTLRRSGITNMFGAGKYLEAEFDLLPDDARSILIYWMQSFGEENR